MRPVYDSRIKECPPEREFSLSESLRSFLSGFRHLLLDVAVTSRSTRLGQVNFAGKLPSRFFPNQTPTLSPSSYNGVGETVFPTCSEGTCGSFVYRSNDDGPGRTDVLLLLMKEVVYDQIYTPLFINTLSEVRIPEYVESCQRDSHPAPVKGALQFGW